MRLVQRLFRGAGDGQEGRGLALRVAALGDLAESFSASAAKALWSMLPAAATTMREAQ